MSEIALNATEHKRLLGFCTLMQIGDRIPDNVDIESTVFKISEEEELVYIEIYDNDGNHVDTIIHDYYETEMYHHVLEDLGIENNMESYYTVAKRREAEGYYDEDNEENVEVEEEIIEEDIISTKQKEKQPLFVEIEEDDDEYETF